MRLVPSKTGVYFFVTIAPFSPSTDVVPILTNPGTVPLYLLYAKATARLIPAVSVDLYLAIMDIGLKQTFDTLDMQSMDSSNGGNTSKSAMFQSPVPGYGYQIDPGFALVAIGSKSDVVWFAAQAGYST